MSIDSASGQPPLLVELQGRLGNQLFGYGLGVALAARTGKTVRYIADYRRAGEYVLPQLLTAAPAIASPSDRRRAGLIQGASIYAGVRRRARRLQARGPTRFAQRDQTFTEKNPFEYDERVFTLEPPRILRGYFQSEEYFSDVGQDIIDALVLPEIELPEDVRAGLISTAAVQFRRGDFVGMGATLPLDYYDRALQRLRETMEVGTLLVLGDDRDFVSLAVEHYRREFPTVLDAYDYSKSALGQLNLLAACQHCVISNSSYAWWAAWIGDHRNDGLRVVVAPDRWNELGTPVPDRWVTVSAHASAR